MADSWTYLEMWAFPGHKLWHFEVWHRYILWPCFTWQKPWHVAWHLRPNTYWRWFWQLLRCREGCWCKRVSGAKGFWSQTGSGVKGFWCKCFWCHNGGSGVRLSLLQKSLGVSRSLAHMYSTTPKTNTATPAIAPTTSPPTWARHQQLAIPTTTDACALFFCMLSCTVYLSCHLSRKAPLVGKRGIAKDSSGQTALHLAVRARPSDEVVATVPCCFQTWYLQLDAARSCANNFIHLSSPVHYLLPNELTNLIITSINVHHIFIT